MIYIVDNILNYLIYLFIIYFCFKLRPRKSKFLLGISVSIVLFAGVFNAYFDTNSPITYAVWQLICAVYAKSVSFVQRVFYCFSSCDINRALRMISF